MQFSETRDKRLLRRIFQTDPIAHLYQWGDLGEPMFSQSRWFVAGEPPEALMLIYSGLAVPAVLATGSGQGIEALLERFRPEVPARFFTKTTASETPLFEARFRLREPLAVTVMGLEKFAAYPQPPRTMMRTLTPDHPVDSLLKLYQHYPGNYFEPSHLKSGLYVGAWLNGILAAVAGTHAYAPEEGVAALGNIVTGTDHRGRGLCPATMSFLIRELRKQGIRHIGLHVESTNAPAIAAYRKVGFWVHSEVTQFMAE
jgi:ribosomal protein S18 acetylase RimI-like enzyme